MAEANARNINARFREKKIARAEEIGICAEYVPQVSNRCRGCRIDDAGVTYVPQASHRCRGCDIDDVGVT